jgi:hypothetical protein
MKKECERTRKMLPRYLHGHVFRSTRKRIEQHLGACVVCRSELDTLRRMDETRRMLQDISSPEGVTHRVKESFFAIAKLKKIIYRPLWLMVIAFAAAGTYYYAMMPRQLDLEIESIVRSAPDQHPPVPAAPAIEPKVETKMVSSITTSVHSTPALKPAAPAAVEPLTVSITPVNETSAIQRINEVMRGHGQLRKLKFGINDRVLSGTLTANELLTFFNRIEPVAKMNYNRKYFESFPSAQPIPFIMTLKSAPKAEDKPSPAVSPAGTAEMKTPAENEVPDELVTEPAVTAPQ